MKSLCLKGQVGYECLKQRSLEIKSLCPRARLGNNRGNEDKVIQMLT